MICLDVWPRKAFIEIVLGRRTPSNCQEVLSMRLLHIIGSASTRFIVRKDDSLSCVNPN